MAGLLQLREAISDKVEAQHGHAYGVESESQSPQVGQKP